MIKVLRCRFQQCLATFTKLLLERFSQTGLFRHLYDYDFGVRNFKLQNPWEKLFCFWDSCIWTGIVKLSLLRRGYFSSPANVLANTPKILQVDKREFFQLNWLGRGQWVWNRVCDADFNSAWALLPCCLSKCSLKRGYLDIYQTTFSESVISEIKKLRRSSFVSKYSKFNLDFKKCSKKLRKIFLFLW